MNGDALYTFEALGTLAGASFLTYLIVQYTKKLLEKLFYMPTDIYAVIIGFIILDLAQIALGASGLDWKIHVLSFFNGFLVAATAAKVHDAALTPPGSKRETPPTN